MKIIGTGSAHPDLVVTNAMLEKFLDTSDEWIVTRTGIHERRVISSEKLEDLATVAAGKALEDAGIGIADIDFFICSNVVNEYVTPSLSCVVLEKLRGECACFDLNGACAGFIYALDIAEAFLKTKDIKNILIVCAEEPARMVSWEERQNCVLFGDGAGAVVVTHGDDLKSVRLTTIPELKPLWQMRKLQPTPFITKNEPDGPLVMNGQEVFKFAVSHSTGDIDYVLKKAGMTPDDIDYYCLHQANKRIIEMIRHFVKQDESKFPLNLDKYGNTSSASIPILLDEMSRDNRLKAGDILLLSAFGAGLTTGACVIRWSK